MSIKSFVKEHPKTVGLALILLIAIIAVLLFRETPSIDETTSEPTARAVTLSSAAALNNEKELSLIGTVRALTEANITTERAGRVTSVNATLGTSVAAGQVVATIENASERAAVLQAEGAYEAALAASAQSVVSLEDTETGLRAARNSAINTFKAAYGVAEGVLFGNIDSLLGNPDNRNPWLRFDADGAAPQLVNGRVALRPVMEEWESRVNTIDLDSDIPAELQYAEEQIGRVIDLVDAYIRALSQADDASLQTNLSTLIARRAELLANQSALQGAETSITSARDAVRRAELGAGGNQISTADAQVKQALGSLRAAQANLEKTIFRSPISGTVNALSVQVGDFVGSFESIAVVANNSAFEIVTFVGDTELDSLAIGDTVLIENEYEGVITTIAPAVDSATQKTEVRIATDNPNIKNGNTVRITKEATLTTSIDEIFVPLSAVKFQNTDGFVMIVEDGVATERPVTLGAVRGTTIEVTDGLEPTDSFIVDVRGLTEGSAVTVTNE
jgi:RND family efflux transporter MFP subunit